MRNFWHKVKLCLLSLEYAFVMFVLCFCIFGATHQQTSSNVSVKYTAPTTSCNVELANFFTYDKDEWAIDFQNSFDTNFKAWVKSDNRVTINFYGTAYWELMYVPIQVEASREYTITFEYRTPSMEVDFSNEGGIPGVGLKAIISTVIEGGGTLKDSAINLTAGSGYYNCPSDTTGTAKLTFTSTTTRTLYFVLNFGYVDDGATKPFEFSNFKLTKKIKFGDTYGTLPDKYNYPITGWEFSNGTKITSSTRCSNVSDHTIYRTVFGYTKEAWLYTVGHGDNSISYDCEPTFISDVRTSSDSFTFTLTGLDGWEYMYTPIYATKTGTLTISFGYVMPEIPRMNEDYLYGEKVNVQILTIRRQCIDKNLNVFYQETNFYMNSLEIGVAKLSFSATRGETYYLNINFGSVEDFVAKELTFSNFSLTYSS